jgi:hypothetical protein
MGTDRLHLPLPPAHGRPEATGPDADEGQATEEQLRSAPPPVDRGRSAGAWPLRVAYLVGVVVFVVAAAVAVSTHAQVRRTEALLAATRGQLNHTVASLAAARSALTTRTGQSETAGRTLASASAQLAADQAQLAHAQAQVYSQGVSISELDICLAGVEKSLNQISVGDESGAASTLSGVASNCRDAEPSGS